MLAVNGLVKRFGGFTAVSNVSFKVEKGEILGLIGPNGSGKSTLVNCICGTLQNEAGSVTFDKTACHAPSPSGNIGSTSSEPNCAWLPGSERHGVWWAGLDVVEYCRVAPRTHSVSGGLPARWRFASGRGGAPG